MNKYIVCLLGGFLFLLSGTHGQSLSLYVEYLNAQTASLEQIRAQLSFYNLQELGMAANVRPTSPPVYTLKNSPNQLYAKLQTYHEADTERKFEKIKQLIDKSRHLYQSIQKIAQKDKLTDADFRNAALLFEDIHILNQEIGHELTERGSGYLEALLPREVQAHSQALEVARKLVLAYRYERDPEIEALSKQLQNIPQTSKKPSEQFTGEFKSILISRITQEEAYNEKVLPVFNLWVDIYNKWIENPSVKQAYQIKLGPEFAPIQKSEIQAVAKVKKPQNLIFLLDVSGSMRKPEKLPLIKKTLIEILPYLHKGDKINILCFAEESRQIISNFSPNNASKIIEILKELEADGNTQPYSSFETAYQIARKNLNTELRTRIILLTDGGFPIDPEKLPALIEEQRYQGASLNIIYSGNHESSVKNRLRKLAQIGNGHYLALGNKNPGQNLLELIQYTESPQ